MAIEYIAKAISYNPNLPVYYEDLAVAYGLKGMPDDARSVSEQCIKKFPDYIPAYRNIAISYNKKGEPQKAHEYDVKIAQLTGQKAQ
jgi:tetratricopeptide (TPR) repeat protein